MISEVGHRIRELRICHNISQKQLADQLGVTASVISAYEVGTRKPSIDNLIALSQIFNTTTDYILGLNSSQNFYPMDLSGLSDTEKKVLLELITVMKE